MEKVRVRTELRIRLTNFQTNTKGRAMLDHTSNIERMLCTLFDKATKSNPDRLAADAIVADSVRGFKANLLSACQHF